MSRSKRSPNHEDKNLLQGTLDLLVLQTLNRSGVMHGYDIARFIQRISNEVLRVEEGSLYPALHRLELDDLIAAEWGHAASGRRAKFYRLRPAGRKRLEAKQRRWRELSAAIELILEPSENAS
jgi:transcriptional regulator